MCVHSTIRSWCSAWKQRQRPRVVLFFPTRPKEKPKEGVVMALGTGKLLDSGTRAEFQVKEKDRVLFSSYAGTEIKIDGEEYLIMNEDDVLAVVN